MVLVNDHSDPSFVVTETLVGAMVCTDKPPDVVIARMAFRLSGTRVGWTLDEDYTPNPYLCPAYPDTRQHYVFVC
ncbi:hypothetical protein LCGC14_1604510 [marine sediment metagenome]|uniref:Uncharacterized protein n=1 Tax=marine sediment metagenome TaxID=412755 RepID=A0A0F9LA54_9ZZZZ